MPYVTWEGVEALPHRFGGIEYQLQKRELGHIHGDHMLDIPFPKKVRDELVVAGMAEPHHLLPDTGWISFYLLESADVERAIALLRRSYDLWVYKLYPTHPVNLSRLKGHPRKGIIQWFRLRLILNFQQTCAFAWWLMVCGKRPGAHGRIHLAAALRNMLDYFDSGLTTWDLADHYGPGG